MTLLMCVRSSEKHDRYFGALLKRCDRETIKLSDTKIIHRQSEVAFNGHLLTSSGLKVDPERIRAIQGMPTPIDKPALMRFHGMIIYLSPFFATYSRTDEIIKTVNEKDSIRKWESEHQLEF